MNKIHVTIHAVDAINDIQFKLLRTLLLAAMIAISSILSLSMLTNSMLATSDKFGIDELYRTVNDGPTWFLDNKDPQEDDNFLMTSAKHIKLQEEGSDVFELDAETGTQKHGVRIHADSPDGEWKNVEMTGYFKLNQGNDQFTLIARQGPTYNDDGGCGAYGYYGLLDSNGDAYFKKKLFHHGGYTDRTAVEKNVVDNLDDRWVGIKMVTYNLDKNEVKLELWVDDGDEENHWKKATEYIDNGDWKVHGSDCDRSSDDIIDDGTRGGFRVDDSEFEFKDLSIREIEPDHRATDSIGDQEDQQTAMETKDQQTSNESSKDQQTAAMETKDQQTGSNGDQGSTDSSNGDQGSTDSSNGDHKG